MVAGCTFLGEVSGTSGWGGLAASTGIENAKNQALEQAGREERRDTRSVERSSRRLGAISQRQGL